MVTLSRNRCHCLILSDDEENYIACDDRCHFDGSSESELVASTSMTEDVGSLLY